MKAIAILSFIALLAGCASNPKQVHVPSSAPLTNSHIVVNMHGDTAFSVEDQAAIARAASTWNAFTNNYVRLDIAWDLDWSSMESIRTNKDKNLILKINSSAPIVDEVDAEAHGRTLAFVDHSEEAKWLPQQLFVISDRISNNEKLFRVALHEFGHVLWLKDSDDRSTVMSKEYEPTTCLTKKDMEAFCDLYHCDVNDMRWCE